MDLSKLITEPMLIEMLKEFYLMVNFWFKVFLFVVMLIGVELFFIGIRLAKMRKTMRSIELMKEDEIELLETLAAKAQDDFRRESEQRALEPVRKQIERRKTLERGRID